MYVGIDLALRNIGMVALDNDGEFLDCGLISSDPKKYNNEELLLHNIDMVDTFVNTFFDKDRSKRFKDSFKAVGLEGLSFNSKSASIDLIAANHWQVRVYLRHEELPLSVIPPKSWMKSILTKDVLSAWAKDYPVTRAKRGMKLTKTEQQDNAKSKAQVRKLGKQLILDSVPDAVRTQLQEYVTDRKLHKDCIYDLSDAYHIARYVFNLRNK